MRNGAESAATLEIVMASETPPPELKGSKTLFGKPGFQERSGHEGKS